MYKIIVFIIVLMTSLLLVKDVYPEQFQNLVKINSSEAKDLLVQGKGLLGVDVVGDIDLRGTTFKERVVISESRIRGNLFLGNSPFSTVVSDDAKRESIFEKDVLIMNSKVEGITGLSGARFLAMVDVNRTEFIGHVFIQGSTFEAPIRMSFIETKDEFYLSGSTFYKEVSIRPGVMHDVFDCSGATFNKNADFTGMIAEKGVYCKEANFKSDLLFYGADITGNANFSMSVFVGNAIFEKSVFREHDKAAYMESNGNYLKAGPLPNGSITMNRSVFLKNINFSGSLFTGEATLRNSQFKGDSFFNNTTFIGSVDFSNSMFEEGALFFCAEFMDDVLFNNVKFSKLVNFGNVSFGKRVILSGAQFHYISLEEMFLNSSLIAIDFDQVKNKIISFKVDCYENYEEDHDLLDCIDLNNQESILAQYRILNSIFKSSGKHNDADNSFVFAKRIERRIANSFSKKLLNYLQDVLFRYGISPWRIMIVGFLSVLLFSIIYYLCRKTFSFCNIEGSDSDRKISFSDTFKFSFSTFIAFGEKQISPKGILFWIVTLEAFWGYIVLALFIVSMVNRLLR